MDVVLLVVLLAVPVALIGLIAWAIVRLVRTRGRDLECRYTVDLPPEGTSAEVLEAVPPVLRRSGYRLVDQHPGGVRFVHKYIPIWAILLAIFLFPLGLLFLLIREEAEVQLIITPTAGRKATVVTALGRAGTETQKDLERALAGLAD